MTSPNPTGQPARTEIPVNVDVQSSDDDLATALHEGAESGGLDERMCAVVLDRLQALLAEEVPALRQQVENLRESAETAVFVANNMSESWRIERDRREELSLHESALRCDLERAEAERDALRQQVEQLRAEAEEAYGIGFEQVRRRCESAEAERDVLRDELEELREATFPKSWAGFKDFIDEVYPDDIFPDDDRALGPQFVVAARRLTEATSERDALQARLAADEAAGRESCREWSDVMADRCGRPADFILWGKLFPPEALGPRCRDCAEKHTRTDRWTVEQSAIFDLRPFAGGTDE